MIWLAHYVRILSTIFFLGLMAHKDDKLLGQPASGMLGNSVHTTYGVVVYWYHNSPFSFNH